LLPQLRTEPSAYSIVGFPDEKATPCDFSQAKISARALHSELGIKIEYGLIASRSSAQWPAWRIARFFSSFVDFAHIC